ncbi:Outer membrane efflux protein [Candidatus Sulfotelmatomonas gaucii]|uniref:Outer membrane efflux protein n=1 Tax=Candidatus Sulfuritelmatomonas gaucii TaxID=2043161 RepID=A0A2N9M6Z1_9BACT|nr:Outer membrane efflux protein [Candidatus Sulfotelmatomonas gaucii]
MKTKHAVMPMKNIRTILVAAQVLSSLVLAHSAFAQGSVRITLEQAIQMALRHNHTLQAARTGIQQNQAAEITANLRPNPTFFTDWEYLPIFSHPQGQSVAEYLQNSTEGDVGLSYLIERGNKRARRLDAAKTATAVTRSQVTDNERGVAFQVGSLFISAQLAQSTLDLAREDLRSFQGTVDISEVQFKDGGMSENDYLKIKLQLLQFQTDVQQALLNQAQALSDLRQQLGYESVPADYHVVGEFEYRPLAVTLEELQAKALQNRPDLRAAVLGVTAANSQYALAKANGKQDPTISANYSHTGGISTATWSFSIPLAIFDRNQGNIAQTRVAIRQAEEQQKAANGQVLTDVRDAYEGLQESARIAQLFRSTYLEVAQKSRDISEYAYRRGALALLDFLDAERSYRATQLAYRQAVAAYLTALEQLRQAVGTRNLP